MDVDTLLSRAWTAVEKSGVPPALQELALKEAIDFLRTGSDGDAGSSDGGGGSGRTEDEKPEKGKKTTGKSQSGATPKTFFEKLAHETGETESDLRDILQLTADSSVHVTSPTKDLGSTLAEQARTVVALVAGARAAGLDEDPVDAEAVRREVERKRCYQQSNFASKHLGPLKGFNAGSNRNQIVITSKWVDEFRAAVAKAHGRTEENKDK